MKHIIIMALMLLQTIAVSAQRNLESSFKTVLSNRAVNILSNSDYNVNCLDGAASYCKFTEFLIPLKKESLLKHIESAISNEQSAAYNVYIKKPGSNKVNHNVGSRYVYGANNEFDVELGTYETHNYYALCYKDENDAFRRHAYIFVWFKTNGNYHCYYYHIYGIIPSKMNEYKAKYAPKPTHNSTIVHTQSFSDDDTVITTSYDANGRVIKTESRPMSVMMQNDTDFMLAFGNMRAVFLDAIKDAEAKTLQTGIVVKLTRLCKEHSKLLTSNEKTTCINSLQEMSKTMQKTNPDSFMDGMLREAINALKK